jgi:hypothetical protein
MDIWLHAFIIWSLDADQLSYQCPDRFSTGKLFLHRPDFGFCESQSLSGHFEEESNTVNLSQESNPDFAVPLMVA